MSDGVPEKPPCGELLLYRTEDGRTRLECRFDEGTIWLSQAQIADLLQTTAQNVTLHLKAIYAEGELLGGELVRITYKFARRVRRGVPHAAALPAGGNPCSGLPGPVASGNSVPAMGNGAAGGVFAEGVRDG